MYVTKLRGLPSLFIVVLTASTECSFGNKLPFSSIPQPRSLADLEEKISTVMAKIEELAEGNARLKFDNSHLKLYNEQLKHDNIQLKIDNEYLKSHLENTVEDRLQYLEAVTRQIVPPTCETLAKLGVSRSGTYLVDPDGVLRGDPPIKVFCEMETATTNVLHDSMESTEIDHCPDPGCYSRRITYDASIKQVHALIELSKSCEQQIRYNCYPTAQTTGDTNYAWWVDRHGDPQYYWNGPREGENIYIRDIIDDCVDCIQSGNCDAEASQGGSGLGTITNSGALPITELRFGGLQSENQKANHTLGALMCRGHNNQPNHPAESCSSLRRAGHTRTGHYLISTKEGRLDVVLCRMDLEDTDVGFQVYTGASIAEEGVYFDAVRVDGWSSVGIIPFYFAEVNIGNGMDPSSGIFTAPLDGIYAFHFHCMTHETVQVLLRSNEVAKATLFSENESNLGQMLGQSILLQLQIGDQVDLYLERGAIQSLGTRGIHFVGYLLYLT
ncbi:unnamed protein product [Darwinula stevensoni]|uniref:C1q domain-containing protein n=1 Tax=Darwinula stevensoni TaxID=69355 RepID=A0A7R9AFZ5_9CRUS|nr:unnamed protein product [Darwinula stevensoni]CAG0903155.1 unnamed protein product [Darwinula stevensoni]